MLLLFNNPEREAYQFVNLQEKTDNKFPKDSPKNFVSILQIKHCKKRTVLNASKYDNHIHIALFITFNNCWLNLIYTSFKSSTNHPSFSSFIN